MYKKCLEKNQANYRAAMSVGEYEYKIKDYDEAVKYLAMVQEQEAKTAAYLLLYGRHLTEHRITQMLCSTRQHILSASPSSKRAILAASPKPTACAIMARSAKAGPQPLTQPFAYITLNNRLTLYASGLYRQLRKINGISLESCPRRLRTAF